MGLHCTSIACLQNRATFAPEQLCCLPVNAAVAVYGSVPVDTCSGLPILLTITSGTLGVAILTLVQKTAASSD